MDTDQKMPKRKIVAQIIREAGSQIEAAKRLNCSQSTVSKLLRREMDFSAELAVKAEQEFPNLVTRAQLRPDLWG